MFCLKNDFWEETKIDEEDPTSAFQSVASPVLLSR